MSTYFSLKYERYLYLIWPNVSCQIFLASLEWVKRAEGFEKGRKWENLYTFELWSKTPFAMNLPFKIFDISNSLEENMNFFGKPVWVIWYTDKRLAARPGTYNTSLKERWLISILLFPILSVTESSAKKKLELSNHQERRKSLLLKSCA